MPAHYRQAKLSTSQLQDAAKKILRIERSAIAAGKDQNLLIGTCQHTALRQEEPTPIEPDGRAPLAGISGENSPCDTNQPTKMKTDWVLSNIL
jgi:hypothetical protein